MYVCFSHRFDCPWYFFNTLDHDWPFALMPRAKVETRFQRLCPCQANLVLHCNFGHYHDQSNLLYPRCFHRSGRTYETRSIDMQFYVLSSPSRVQVGDWFFSLLPLPIDNPPFIQCPPLTPRVICWQTRISKQRHYIVHFFANDSTTPQIGVCSRLQVCIHKFLTRVEDTCLLTVISTRTCSTSKPEADHYYHDDNPENRRPTTRPPSNGNLHPSISHPGSLVAPVVAMPRHIARQVAPTPPTSSSSSSTPSATVATSSASSFKLEIGAIVGIALGSGKAFHFFKFYCAN